MISRDTIRQSFNKYTGYDIVRCAGQHTLRTHLSALFRKYEIADVIDVGANEGQFGSMIRDLGFAGKIYSFEPVLEAYAKLSKASARDRDWRVFNFALGSAEGNAEINVSGFTSFSSLLKLTDYAVNRWEDSKVSKTESIRVRTLDTCVNEGLIELSANSFLKMDTQGYDLEVFKGARGTLRNIKCMLSEISLIPVYENMPHYVDSISLFEEHGFRVSGLYPITRNKDMSLNEMDCLLVNVAGNGA